MKKSAVTIFAVLYVALILTASAQRSKVWAVRTAEAFAHSCCDQHSHSSGAIEKSATHLWQTKLVETEFVVELPRQGPAGPTHAERYTALPSFEFHAIQSGLPFSSRAPPSHA